MPARAAAGQSIFGFTALRVRTLAGGAAWTYGSQLVTVFVQFSYAAVTSRLVSEIGFGDYAIALVASSFFTIVATSGLDQAASRHLDLDRKTLSALLCFALGFGLVGATALFSLSPALALLWGSASATPAISLMAAGVMLSPAAGFCSGLLRRQGRFRQLALLTLAANLAGMSVGVIVVFRSPSASSLLVFPILSLAIVLVGGVSLNARHLLSRPSFREATRDLDFGWRVAGNRVLVFLERAILTFGLSRSGGVDVVGQLNRAEVVTLIPIQQLQVALLQPLYWDLRSTGEVPVRAKRVWTDLLVLVSWVAIPLAAFGAYFAPLAVPILFGPGWEIAAQLAAFIVVSAGLQMVASMLTVGLEAAAHFRPISVAQISVLALLVIGAMLALIFGDYWVLVVTIVCAPVLRHLVQLLFARRLGLVDLRQLLRGYCVAMAFGLAFALAPLYVAWLLIDDSASQIAFGVGALACYISIVILCRRWLPPWVIFISYRRDS